jgi:hypothetical protein
VKVFSRECRLPLENLSPIASALSCDTFIYLPYFPPFPLSSSSSTSTLTLANGQATMTSKAESNSSKEDHIGEKHVRRSISVRLIRHSGECIL